MGSSTTTYKNEEPQVADLEIDPAIGKPAAFMGGGLGGALAGAAAGAMAGPGGVIVGAAIGGVVGARSAEGFVSDPEGESLYWEENFPDRPYATRDRRYEDYDQAYRAGYEVTPDLFKDENTTFDEVEATIRKNYEARNTSGLPWEGARPAAKDAFDRVRSSFRRS